MNANFFEFADGRIAFMLIYYANIGAAEEETPTGYPRNQR